MSVEAALTAACASVGVGLRLCIGAARRTQTPFHIDGFAVGVLIVGVAGCAVLFASGAVERALLIACLAVSWVSDRQSGLIYDRVLLAAGVGVLVVASFGGHERDVVVGAATGMGGMYALYVVSRGRGLGLGDVKLAGVIGAAFGSVAGTVVALAAAFVIGGLLVSAGLLLRRIRVGAPVAFAPFLSMGSAAAMLHVGALVGLR